MSFDLLALTTASQLAVLLLLLLGMLLARLSRVALEQVHEREVSEASALIQAWLGGNADESEIESRIARLSDHTFFTILRAYSSTVKGGRWERLATLLRGSPCFASIKRCARSPFWWRRLESARLLALLARDAELDLVRRLLADRNHAVHLAAVRILKRVPDKELLQQVFIESTLAAPVLQAYLFDVLQSHDRSVADVVLERLDRTDDITSLGAAIRYVEEVADPLYMNAILRLVQHPEPAVRGAAARTMAVFPHGRSAAALVRRLDDHEASVREAVCEALGKIGAVEVAGAVRARLNDASRRVRLAACVALRRLGVVGVGILRDEERRVDGENDVRLVRYVLSLEPDALMQHYSLPG